MKDIDITRVFMEYRDVLIKAVSRYVQHGEVEEIVQETYIRTYKRDQRKKIQHPRSFMFKTAKNLALDYLKKAETRLNESMDAYDFESLVNAVSDETYERIKFEEKFQLFCKSVRNLPLRCRRAFILKKVYGLKQKEIAEYMNISEKTVEKHLAHGLLKSNEYLSSVYKSRRDVVKTLNVDLKHNEVRS